MAVWAQAAVAFVIYVLGLYIYRVYFSPLSRFPGPKLAAASLFYEGYYDIVKDGRFPWKIREMHQKYGPVVRVNPREIHIHDPDYVDQLYVQRLDKDPWFSQAFGIPLSMFGTWQQNAHRLRRGAVNKFFSKASITSRVDVIQEQVLKLCNVLKASAESGEVVQLDAGFISLTLDIISQFCYGINYKFLDVPGFDKDFKAVLENAFGSGAFMRQYPWILSVMGSLPSWLAMRLMPQVAGVLRLQELNRVEAKRVLALKGTTEANTPAEPSGTESYFDTESAGISRKATIFEQILDSSLAPEEKSEERLVQDGQSLLAAGSETTGRALYLSVVHLLEQPAVLARLRREIATVMPSPSSTPSLQQLEQLPFLTAVIKESIRLGGSTATRTSRLSPADRPLRYKDWVFPPGTPVSVTLFDVLMDPDIFPEPEVFDPMRWLERGTGKDGAETLTLNTALDKYFVAFSRGPRSCIGMWLAWSELYLTMAHVHRKFDLELYETSVVDVAAACDRFSCFAKPGTHGVRVKVKGLRAA